MSLVSSFDEIHLTSRIVAAFALVLISPLLLLAALAIKITSRGPVLYRAPRAGLSGRPFVMLKLRTMHGAPTDGVKRITSGQDTRISPVGRWLRKLKIDELPQLVNVVRGDMVLVGPRPEDPSIVDDFYTPFMRRTLTVLPGLTSPGSLDYFAREERLPSDPAEAERVYVASLLPRKAALDLVYIQNRCWHYDLQLVVRTAASMVGARALFPRRRAWEGVEAADLIAALEGPQVTRELS